MNDCSVILRDLTDRKRNQSSMVPCSYLAMHASVAVDSKVVHGWKVFFELHVVVS